ncbi:hypothetical protein Q5752_001294 [Cryptotrichosporon argae]
MPTATTLSTAPIVILSRPTPSTWLITLASPPDNRLTPALLGQLAARLDTVEAEWRALGGGKADPRSGKMGKDVPGALVITSGVLKFFSNGLDYASAMKDERFFEHVFDPVAYRLLTFPLVTVAAINGHAFAGGMVLALCCDFRVMTSSKGLLSMNEISFGSPFPNSFSALLALKIPPRHLRDTLLGKRWAQRELLDVGLVDAVVDDSAGSAPVNGQLGAVVRQAVEVGEREGKKVGLGAWDAIKEGVYYPVMEASKGLRPIQFPYQKAEEFEQRMAKERAKL